MILKINVNILKNKIDPFANYPWGCIDLKENNVNNCLKDNDLLDHPLGKQELEYFGTNLYTHYHASRIAYLVKNGWNDPIIINSKNDEYIIDDGSHRFCAAIVRKDEMIHINIEDDNIYHFLEWLNQ